MQVPMGEMEKKVIWDSSKHWRLHLWLKTEPRGFKQGHADPTRFSNNERGRISCTMGLFAQYHPCIIHVYMICTNILFVCWFLRHILYNCFLIKYPNILKNSPEKQYVCMTVLSSWKIFWIRVIFTKFEK